MFGRPLTCEIRCKRSAERLAGWIVFSSRGKPRVKFFVVAESDLVLDVFDVDRPWLWSRAQYMYALVISRFASAQDSRSETR